MRFRGMRSANADRWQIAIDLSIGILAGTVVMICIWTSIQPVEFVYKGF
jgi:hypothetical protein